MGGERERKRDVERERDRDGEVGGGGEIGEGGIETGTHRQTHSETNRAWVCVIQFTEPDKI